MGGALGAIIGFAVVVRVTLVLARQRRRAHIASTEKRNDEGGETAKRSVEDSQQCEGPRVAGKEDPGGFVLEWTTIRSSRAEGGGGVM